MELKMELKQAIEVVTQAINIALGAGAFKSTKDVAVINAALDTITNVQEEKHGIEDPQEVRPKNKK